MSKWSKAVSIIAVLFVLAGAIATPAFAADGANHITLVESYYVHGKGPVFTFQVNGELSKADLASAFMYTPEKEYSLYCVQTDATTVKCTAPKKTAGKTDIYVSLAGFAFWTDVPVERGLGYCYTVHDWDFEGVWGPVGVYCQGKPGQVGDWIEFYNPVDWESTFTYQFLLNGYDWYEAGEGYYFPSGEPIILLDLPL